MRFFYTCFVIQAGKGQLNLFYLVTEHILKALSSLQTTEEKLAALCKKYADLHEEHRVLQASFKQSQRKLAVVRINK